MKTVEHYAKLCAEENGACPAWRDGCYPQMCACRQQNETRHRRFMRGLIITIGCLVVAGPLGLLLAL
jgi:hypothetical protein